MTQDHRIVWGDLTLAEPMTVATSDGALIEAMAAGTNYGNPATLVEVVQSLLTDGAVAVVQGWDNREVAIRLRLSGTGSAMAAAEAALFTYCRSEQPPPLEWTPPADGSVTTIFDVVVATLERDTSDDWDFVEVTRDERFYVLTLTCLPFARGTEKVTLPALAINPPTPTVAPIDDGTSLAGWSVESSGYGTVLRTNLVKNPSFETNLSGWSAHSSDTLQRKTTSGFSSSAHAVVSTGGANQSAVVADTPFTVTAGESFAASVYVKFEDGMPAWTGDTFVRLRWFDSAGDLISTDESAAYQLTNSWTRLSVVAEAPAGTKTAMVGVRGSRTPSGPIHIAFDAVMVEQSTTVGVFFDGSTADAGTVGYDWTAGANSSTSVEYTIPTAVVDAGSVGVPPVARFRFGDVFTNIILIRTGAVSMSGLPFLKITLSSGADSDDYTQGNNRFFVDGAQGIPIWAGESATAGYWDYYLMVSDFNELRIDNTSYPDPDFLKVANIEATDTLPQLAMQRSRFTTVLGSAPTTAQLRLFDSTSQFGLGIDNLIYTSTSTFAPNLRQKWHISGDTTSDASMLSGAVDDITAAGAPSLWRIPVSQLERGMYALVMQGGTDAGPVTFEWNVVMMDAAGNPVLGSEVSIDDSVTIDGSQSESQPWILGNLHLPPVESGNSPAFVQIALTTNTTEFAGYVDELWLFSMDNGALTWVQNHTFVDLRWIEIRSPELGAPRPSVFGSVNADGSNPVNIDHLCQSFGSHRFEPGQMQIFTATSFCEGSQSEIEFYPRFHSHVSAT